MATERLKIAYLCDLSPEKVWSYSGGNAQIYNALNTHVGDVTILSEGWHHANILRRAISFMPSGIQLRLRWRAHMLLSSIIARGVSEELNRQRYDILFCAYSFHSLLGLKLPYPLLTVFTSDATQTIYKQSELGGAFGSYLSLSRLMDPLVLNAERKVFRSTDLLLWPSAWLKQGADVLYGLNDSQSHVVPWGANIVAPPRTEVVFENPFYGKVRLLLIGRDWFAKGGPRAFEILSILVAQGIDAHLTVVGCVPPDEHLRAEMTVYSSLNKSDPQERQTFDALLKNAHFLVMPSYESYGFAFCEASAYGLPSLCLRVGGVPIVDNVNGHALPPASSADKFAEVIVRYRNQPEAYKELRESTRNYFEEALNWDVWGKNVSELIQSALQMSLPNEQK